MIPCPICGSPDCLKTADDVLAVSAVMYAPCIVCEQELPLDKLAPFVDHAMAAGKDAGLCRSCGKRHIDYVMAHVLSILIRQGLKSDLTPLKDVGTPLIEYGVELAGPPRLGVKSLIVVLDDIDSTTAGLLVAEVPQVKGVIRRAGGSHKSVGLMDTPEKPHVYELLAGCDMRADVLTSMMGAMVFYRNQSQMHIEFWRNNSVKIKVLEKMFLNGELEGKVIVDGFASAGTLGLLAAGSGARKVILNDAWLPAIRNILINIEANKTSLGVKLEQVAQIDSLPTVSDHPVLVARATGSMDIEVYHADFRALAEIVKSCDVCIIDPFPGVSADEFSQIWRGITKDKIVIL